MAGTALNDDAAACRRELRQSDICRMLHSGIRSAAQHDRHETDRRAVSFLMNSNWFELHALEPHAQLMNIQR
jgi:hypothetical protein